MNPDIHLLLREKLTQARQENQGRRDRVLKHPDLAARLCQPPLSYARAEQWNGFVPPKYLPEGLPGQPVRLNTSPRRAVLVEVSVEALRREGERDE